MHRHDRLLAIVGTLLINGLAFYFLCFQSTRPVETQDADSLPLEVIWIPRAPNKNQQERVPLKKHKGSGTSPARHQERSENGPNTVIASESTTHPSASMVLNLDIAPEPISLQRNPLERLTPLAEAPPDRLNLRFTDRSFGGVVQRMTKSSICRELRNSLASQQGDKEAIINTMKQQGCRA